MLIDDIYTAFYVKVCNIGKRIIHMLPVTQGVFVESYEK